MSMWMLNLSKCKNDDSWNPSSCICKNSKYLKSIAHTSVTECNEIRTVMDTIAAKKKNIIAPRKVNAIAINVTSTASINFYSKNVRDCYILRTVLLAIILLLIIGII